LTWIPAAGGILEVAWILVAAGFLEMAGFLVEARMLAAADNLDMIRIPAVTPFSSSISIVTQVAGVRAPLVELVKRVSGQPAVLVLALPAELLVVAR
jgi:hypothetical protein